MLGKEKIPTIVGNPAIIVVDIFESDFGARDFSDGIPSMAGARERMDRAAELVKKGRNCGIPIVVIHEIHRPNGIDFGRELDGSETEHCIQDFKNPQAQLPFKGLEMTEDDYVVYKRRYSAFYQTDLELLLKGLKAETLILVGGMTDICVHYTFVDGHQGDYHCRVVSDCVSGSSQDAHDASLKAMEYLQAGSVMTADDMERVFEEYAEKNKAVV
jgi:nicotinamidase-related amidase